MTSPAKNPPVVFLTDGVPSVTSLAIAEGAEVEHKATLQLVRRYLSDLKEFGRVTFEMRPFATEGGPQSREVAILNEPQTTLLFTYMKNSAVVRSFKKRLVREFYALAHAARSKALAPPDPLSPEIRALINRKAQALALASYELHRDWLERNARRMAREGWPETQARAWLESVDTGDGETVLVRRADLKNAARSVQTAAVALEFARQDLARLQGAGHE